VLDNAVSQAFHNRNMG